MSIISKSFNNKINNLKGEFEVNKSVVHQGIKGGLNENGILLLIKDVIPQKFKLTKGVTENSKGDQSNESDILIYNDEILPPYIKEDLTFVPIEAVKYIFEVKSTLNSKELKTTIGKFERFGSIGGTSPTVLFSFSSDIKGSELGRYKKNESAFYTKPNLIALCVSDKCYYFKHKSEHYLKDQMSNTDFIKLLDKSDGSTLQDAFDAFRESISNNELLSKMSRVEFASFIKNFINMDNNINNLDKKELTVNGIKYSEIKFTVHRWYGIESTTDNDVILSLLSGISNTLSQKSFGSYLLSGKKLDYKVFAICYEDMWGNLSAQDFDEKGLKYDTERVSFKFESSNDYNKMIFTINKDKSSQD